MQVHFSYVDMICAFLICTKLCKLHHKLINSQKINQEQNLYQEPVKVLIYSFVCFGIAKMIQEMSEIQIKCQKGTQEGLLIPIVDQLLFLLHKNLT